MSEIPKRAGPTLLGTSTATIYTAPANPLLWAIVRSILVTNVTAGTVTVTVGIGTSNSDTAAKRIINAMPLGAGESLEVLAPGFQPLAGHAQTPDLLYALSNTASGATITLGLVEGP